MLGLSEIMLHQEIVIIKNYCQLDDEVENLKLPLLPYAEYSVSVVHCIANCLQPGMSPSFGTGGSSFSIEFTVVAYLINPCLVNFPAPTNLQPA